MTGKVSCGILLILFSPVMTTMAATDKGIEVMIPEYVPPPFERFSAISQRPLFVTSRRPVMLVKPAARKVAPKREVKEKDSNIFLSGVIHDGAEYIALVRKGKKGELIQLRINKSLGGWKLLEIKPEEITLNKGASFSTVRLRDNKPVNGDKNKALRARKIKAEKLRKARLLRKKKLALRAAKKRK